MAQKRCPECDGRGLKIVYGMTGIESKEAQERGELVLGGCDIEPDSPEWQCADCGHRWGEVW